MVLVRLTESDKKFIRAYVAEGRDEEERRQRRRECAEQFGVKLSIVSAVTAWTKIWSDKGVQPPEKVEQPPVVEVEEVKEETKEEVTVVQVTEQPTEELTEEELEKIEVVDGIDGSHVNYDNPIKQVWRERWKAFVAKQTVLHERDRMKVLCLPGKRCLEIPVYLDLGFKPHNIFGVEGGDEAARREFSQSAESYGIVPKIGRLENLLPKMKETFDIISLDFPGPLSKTCLDIVKMLPLAPTGDATADTKSLFMINLLAKRETKETQQFLDYYASFDRPEIKQMLSGPNQGLDRFKNVCRYMNDLEDKVHNGENVYESDLMDKRKGGLVFVITSLIAADRRSLESRWRNYSPQAPNLSRKDFGNVASYVLAALVENLSPFVKQRALDFLTVGVPHLLAIVGNYKPFVYDIEQYQYTSPVNNRNGRVGNSPFFTEMYRLLTPMSDYGRARFFIRFFMDAIYWKACHPRKHIFLDVRNKQGHVKAPCDGLDHKDTIEFIDRDGALISSIPWQKIMDTYKLIVNHIGNDKVTNILTEGQLSRINLN